MTEQEVKGLCPCALSTRLPHCLCRACLGRDKEGRRLYSDAYKACPPTLTGPTTAATVQVRGGWAVECACEGSRSLTWGTSGGAMAGAWKLGYRSGGEE